MESHPTILPPELGSIVSLDHVNLRVPDQRLATLFFIEGLGLTRDPYRMAGTGNMWINVGKQQLHLPTAEPQPFPGEIGLTLPDLDALKTRLLSVAEKLAETEFAIAEEGGALAVSDPWGRRLRLFQHQQGAAPGGEPLALAYVKFQVAPGASAGIGDFYREQLYGPTGPLEGGEGTGVAVRVGPHQTLAFVERQGAAPWVHNNHVCLYVTRYAEIFDNLARKKVPAEEENATQFRFREIPDGHGGAALFHCEHEVRSLYHQDYGRALLNRMVTPQ